jgi:hypothetical protein
MSSVDRNELESMGCWFAADDVDKGGPMTEFKRRARLHQARWREANGHPMGSQKIKGTARRVGSRLESAYAKQTMANFLSPGVRQAMIDRVRKKEPLQTFNTDLLYADLLSSLPLSFNLFGELAMDPRRAEAAVAAWWPQLSAANIAVRLQHSPGRDDPRYLNDRTAFDAAVYYETPAARRGIIGISTKYAEHASKEKAPVAARLARYEEVTRKAKVFHPEWRDAVVGTDLQSIWIEHLLVLAMLQGRGSARYAEGRLVLVVPEQNVSFRSAAERYAAVLSDHATFEVRTLEALLDAAASVLPARLLDDLRQRYLFT